MCFNDCAERPSVAAEVRVKIAGFYTKVVRSDPSRLEVRPCLLLSTRWGGVSNSCFPHVPGEALDDVSILRPVSAYRAEGQIFERAKCSFMVKHICSLTFLQISCECGCVET